MDIHRCVVNLQVATARLAMAARVRKETTLPLQLYPLAAAFALVGSRNFGLPGGLAPVTFLL